MHAFSYSYIDDDDTYLWIDPSVEGGTNENTTGEADTTDILIRTVYVTAQATNTSPPMSSMKFFCNLLDGREAYICKGLLLENHVLRLAALLACC